MINEENRLALIEYRLNQAKQTISESKLLIDNNMLSAAMNRIYYGMFYAILALGLKYQFESSKHVQLIGWFNKTFIKTALIPIKFGDFIHDAFKKRMQGDYDEFIDFSKDEIMSKFENMKQFIFALENFINNKPI